MKISIVISLCNEAKYVEDLIDFIKPHSNPNNIEEIIILESFETKRIIKVAEKSHAKLFHNQLKAEVIYFIKPAFILPIGFNDRIIKYVGEKYEMGGFKTNENYVKFKKKALRFGKQVHN